MKTMAAPANLEGKHTNHSAPHTIITTPRHENVTALDISQPSGHKNKIHRQLFYSLRRATEDVLNNQRQVIRQNVNETCSIQCTKQLCCICQFKPIRFDFFFWCSVNQCFIVMGSEPPVPVQNVIDM